MSKRVFQKGDAVMVYRWGRREGAEVWEEATVVDPLVKAERWLQYAQIGQRVVGDPKGRHVGISYARDGRADPHVWDIFNTRTLILSTAEYEAVKLPAIQAARDRLAAEAAKRDEWLPNLVDEIIEMIDVRDDAGLRREAMIDLLRERVRPR